MRCSTTAKAAFLLLLAPTILELSIRPAFSASMAPLPYSTFSAVLAAEAQAQDLRAGQVRVRVENPADVDRPDEVVELGWTELEKQLPAVAADRVRVLDAGTGEEMPVQAVDNDGDGNTDELLFLARIFAGQQREFVVEAVAPSQPATSRAYAMHVEERDDVAWENDRIAFRTYGEGLWELEELVSSGIDVWMKRTRDLVLDRWYEIDDYHRDVGEGADFFSVGAALGAGGTALWRDGEIYRAPNFTSHRILADGPLRAIIELSYGPFDAGGVQVQEVKRITIDAGDHAFRSESIFQTPSEGPVRYATGLVDREGMIASTGVPSETNRWSWLSGWGPVARANGGHGDLGTAVLVPTDHLVERTTAAGHQLLVAEVDAGASAPHYVAAGWTASGDFEGPQAWWDYLDDLAERLSRPLRISFRTDPVVNAARDALGKAHDRLAPLLDDPADPEAIPYSLSEEGTFKGVSSSSWTSGFYPGMLWHLYDATADPAAADAARRWTDVLEREKANAGTHDLGFMIYNSFGNAYRLTGTPYYREVVIDAANTLMTRYNPTVGAIRSWDFGEWQYPVIVDNMMNLELLFAASRLTGDDKYHDVAVEHARTTLEHHYRDDYSSVHVVDFDTLSGEVIAKQTHQGLSDESAWSRGQAWGLYGFTMTYRETGDDVFLEQARRIADFILSHPNLPDDAVPYWDFDVEPGPDQSRDASAAAITASALYELSRYVTGDERTRYVDAADRMLMSLTSPSYQAPDGTPGPFLLTHSTGSVPGEFEVDVPIIYADYYYLEALLRRLRLQDGG